MHSQCLNKSDFKLDNVLIYLLVSSYSIILLSHSVKTHTNTLKMEQTQTCSCFNVFMFVHVCIHVFMSEFISMYLCIQTCLFTQTLLKWNQIKALYVCIFMLCKQLSFGSTDTNHLMWLFIPVGAYRFDRDLITLLCYRKNNQLAIQKALQEPLKAG